MRSDRIDADLACGRHAEVAGQLGALVREHPLRERLRGEQMLALYRAGRQAEALEAYRSAPGAVDGLGIEPSPDLRALEAAILALRGSRRRGRARAPAGRKPLPSEARRLVTCVFAQLRSERPAPTPSRCGRCSSATTRTPTRVCAEHDGVVVESRSDAVLAVSGAPVAHEDAAQRALGRPPSRRANAGAAARAASPLWGVATGEVVAAARRGTTSVFGESVGAAERLGRAAALEEICIDAPTWGIVATPARATALGERGFRLEGFDPATGDPPPARPPAHRSRRRAAAPA